MVVDATRTARAATSRHHGDADLTRDLTSVVNALLPGGRRHRAQPAPLALQTGDRVAVLAAPDNQRIAGAIRDARGR